MGDVEENIEALAPHVRGGVFRGYIYSISRVTPPLHNYCEDLTGAQRDAVRAAAQGTEQQWLDAHPPGVKAWLLARPANIRAAMHLGAKHA